MSVKLKPLADRVLIEPAPAETTHKKNLKKELLLP